ncbi:hypothetical protein DL93DRAFT_499059 [Clavulina sp. PMI_390]|nr:hypothetical protein DL93DRAFT_499059 [Clavulina sp. PMI_390]
MGIVTVQFFAFSRRFWQDRKAAVLVVSLLPGKAEKHMSDHRSQSNYLGRQIWYCASFVVLWSVRLGSFVIGSWCNIIGLLVGQRPYSLSSRRLRCPNSILLGEPVYHCLITRFKGGSVDHFTITLTRRYMMMMIPNIMSRAILAYSVALHTACFFASGLLSKTLETLFHLVIAFRVVINAVVVRAVLDSMTEHNPQVKEGYPPLLKISTSLSIATECVLCALLCKAIFHASKNGEQ